MIHLVGGDNTYQSEQKINSLKADFLNTGGSIKVYDAEETGKIDEIINDASSFSFFDTSTLFIIKRLLTSKRSVQDKFLIFLEGTAKSKEVNFILWESKKFDKRLKLYRYIKSKGSVDEYDLLRYVSLKSWIQKYTKGKISMSSNSIDSLIIKVGNDQEQLTSILDNLIMLTRSDGRNMISRDDIEKFVDKTTEESIWEFIDAIGKRNKGRALYIIETLAREKKDFMMIIAMMARQLRILALTRYLKQIGKGHSDIIKILKLHPFVVRKAIEDSQNFNLAQLAKLYNKLMHTDLVIKEGRFSDKLALDLFITAL